MQVGHPSPLTAGGRYGSATPSLAHREGPNRGHPLAPAPGPKETFFQMDSISFVSSHIRMAPASTRIDISMHLELPAANRFSRSPAGVFRPHRLCEQTGPPLLCPLRQLCKEPGACRGAEDEAASWALSPGTGGGERAVVRGLHSWPAGQTAGQGGGAPSTPSCLASALPPCPNGWTPRKLSHSSYT